MAANCILCVDDMLTSVVFPFFFLMSFLVFFGTIFRFSRASWFGIWGGLELNLICFIPMVVHFSRFLRVERVVKYFLVQSFGRIGLLFGGLVEDSLYFNVLGGFVYFLIFRLLLKVGVFPFHWWVPGVLGGLGWFGVLFFSTWQKVAPVLIFSGFCSVASYLIVFCIFSSFFGGLRGIGQTNVRLVLGYSSIGHSGWFFSLFCVSLCFGIFYFFFYIISTLILILGLWILDYSRFNQHVKFSLIGVVFFFFGVLSVAGLPPFLGFFGKMLGFFAFGSNLIGLFFLSILVLGSLMSLYFYFGLFFSSFFMFFSSSFFNLGYGLVLLFLFSVLFGGFGLFGLDYLFFYYYDILV